MDPRDDASRAESLKQTIRTKASLRRYYREVYSKYEACLERCPKDGAILELGSGMGFLKEILPQAITSDVLPYPGLDGRVDARHLPFASQSLRLICMLDVFHHIPDVESFLEEVQRCLVPGGRLLLIDQHAGWVSTPILKYFHDEPYDSGTPVWKFQSTGPGSGANGALAWMVFRRDRELFASRFPRLQLETYRPHTPLRYWLTGGLKSWTLLPGWAFPLATTFDRLLVMISQDFGSFVDIEVVKKGASSPPGETG
jgi:SAM-dependent methyltransferase